MRLVCTRAFSFPINTFFLTASFSDKFNSWSARDPCSQVELEGNFSFTEAASALEELF